MAGRYAGLGFSGASRGYADTTRRYTQPTSPSMGGSRGPLYSGTFGSGTEAPSFYGGAEGLAPLLTGTGSRFGLPYAYTPLQGMQSAVLGSALSLSSELALLMWLYGLTTGRDSPAGGPQMIQGWHSGYNLFCSTGGAVEGYVEPFGTCGSALLVDAATAVRGGTFPYSGVMLAFPGSQFYTRTEGWVHAGGAPSNPKPIFWPAPWWPYPNVIPAQNPIPWQFPAPSPKWNPGTPVQPMPGPAPEPGWPPYPTPSPFPQPEVTPMPRPGPAPAPGDLPFPRPGPSPAPAPGGSPAPAPVPAPQPWPFPSPRPGTPTMPVLPVFPPGPWTEVPTSDNRGTSGKGRQKKMGAAWRVVANLVTEGLDVLECAWGALPKEARIKGAKSTPKVGGSCRSSPKSWRYYDPNKNGGKGGWVTKYAKDRRGRPAKPTPQTQAGDLARCWDKVDWGDFRECVVKNVLTDAGIGLLAGGARRGQARSPSSPRPTGPFGTGA